MPKTKKCRAARPKLRPPLADMSYDLSEGVTQSLLSRFVHCRVACRATLDGWEQQGTKDSLAFGSLFHDLLHGLYDGIRTGKLKTTDEALEAYFHKRVRPWRKLWDGSASSEVNNSELLITKAYAVFLPYCRHYATRDFKPGSWVALEGVFDVPRQGWRLRGRIDGLRKISSAPWLFETKTSGQIREDEITSTLGFNFQNLFYIVAQNALFHQRKRKHRVSRIQYNMIRRPGYKFDAANDTLQDYVEKVRKDIKKDPGRWFVRFHASYTQEEIAAFHDELAQKLDEFRSWLEGDLFTYRNQRACTGRGRCDFIPMCASGTGGYERTGRLFVELED